MIIFEKQLGAERGASVIMGPVTSERFSLSMEAGESFVINTPLGELQVERTADTMSITCWDGFVAFDAQSENGLWQRDIPLPPEEQERRRLEFEASERACSEPNSKKIN